MAHVTDFLMKTNYMNMSGRQDKQWWVVLFQDPWRSVFLREKTQRRTIEEVNFIQKVLELRSQAKILDVPCGDGRHSIELAKRKFKVTGVDINQQFLDIARDKTEFERLKIVWQQRDMRDLPWREKFDAAFSFWGSFGYFDDKGNIDFLKAVSRVLKPGAKFLVDTHVAETLLPNLSPERIWKQVGKTLLLEEKSYDCASSRVNTEWTFIHHGEKSKRYSSIRIYTFRQLCDLLRSVGFNSFRGYGLLNGDPFHVGSSRLYLVAKKKRKVSKISSQKVKSKKYN